MEYFLGIDAGGTKTAAVIIEENGLERGRGIGGPCSLATSDFPTLTRSVREAARSACRAAGLPEDTRFAGVCAGVAGYSLKTKRADFLAILAEEVSADRYDLAPDYEIAYWGASGGEPGVVVIAGTGSVAFGRNAQGETYKSGGLGYVLGDNGSGFALGKSALSIVVRHLTKGVSSPFSEAILAEIKSETLEDLLEWVYADFSPAKVATLASNVGRLADADDETAQTMLINTLLCHLRTTSDIRKKLELPEDAPVYRLGGLWKCSAYFRALPFAFSHYYPEGESIPKVEKIIYNLSEPLHNAAIGAALLARSRQKNQG